MTDQEQSAAEEAARWHDFGQWLRKRRLELGYTQAHVASRAGISTQNLVALEHGGFRRRAGGPWTLPNPRDENLKALARIYRVSAEEMYRQVGHYADRPQTRAALRRRATGTKRVSNSDLIADLQRRVEAVERELREQRAARERQAAPRRRRASG